MKNMENENLTNEQIINKQQIEKVKNNLKKMPLFFVDRNQLQINVYIVYNVLDGSIITISTTKIQHKMIQGIEQLQYTFVFTKPNYQQISRYKQLAMYWDNYAKNTIVNPFKLRSYIILNHLKSWKNVTNELGQQVKLQIDVDGTLTQDSLTTVYQVNPAIMDCVMKQFQRLTNYNF